MTRILSKIKTTLAASNIGRLIKYLYWVFRLTVRWTEPDFFRKVRVNALDLAHKAKIRSGGSRVLLYTIRQDRDQVAMMLTLYWSLRLRGHTPVVTNCDGVLLRTCNYGNYPKLSRWDCQSCALYAKHTHKIAGSSADWIGEILPKDARSNAEKIGESIPVPQFDQFVYKDIHVGALVRQSVAHFLRTDRIMDQPESVRTYREWIVAGIWLVDACEELVKRQRPDVILMLNGLFAPERIMLEVARKRGIRTVCYEVGFRPHTFFFQHNQPTDMCDNGHWPQFRDTPLSQRENEELDQYAAERATGGGYLLNYFPNLQSSRNKITADFGIDLTKKIFVLFPNITWDSTLFEKHAGFGSMMEWIGSTIRYFAENTQAQLVIRVHPAEVILPGSRRDSVMELVRRDFPIIPPNVILVPPDSGASSYVLMNIADCGLVYGSTTGLEMGIRGIPVVVAGRIYYRGLGFTYDAVTPAQYRELLSDVIAGRIKKGDHRRLEAWRRYAYFAIFRSAIHLPQVAYPTANILPTLTYTTTDALKPRVDKNLDVVCDGVVNGKPFLSTRS